MESVQRVKKNNKMTREEFDDLRNQCHMSVEIDDVIYPVEELYLEQGLVVVTINCRRKPFRYENVKMTIIEV